MTPLSRAARAHHGAGWDDLGPERKAVALEAMRRALGELREPGEAALDAGWVVGINEQIAEQRTLPEGAARVWQAMLDAILAEPQP